MASASWSQQPQPSSRAQSRPPEMAIGGVGMAVGGRAWAIGTVVMVKNKEREVYGEVGCEAVRNGEEEVGKIVKGRGKTFKVAKSELVLV